MPVLSATRAIGVRCLPEMPEATSRPNPSDDFDGSFELDYCFERQPGSIGSEITPRLLSGFRYK